MAGEGQREEELARLVKEEEFIRAETEKARTDVIKMLKTKEGKKFLKVEAHRQKALRKKREKVRD